MSPFPELEAALAQRLAQTVDEPGRSPAAVAVVLVTDPDAVLLIRRAEREDDRWSGHMAFPGGRWSPSDPDLVATARRETLEEVGVDLSDAQLLGALDDITPRTPSLPPVSVRPFVFYLAQRQPLALNHEVAGALYAPLLYLREPGVYRPFEYTTADRKVFLPGYHLSEGLVWGMTERILTPLLGLIGESAGQSGARAKE
ncbi:MAG: CoA pyrophosphatase [Gemmatimonadota bacterium]